MKMFKNGKEALVDKNQKEIFLKAGWSLTKETPKKEETVPVADASETKETKPVLKKTKRVKK